MSADDEPFRPLTAQQLGLCGPLSDDPGVGPDAARLTPPADDQTARTFPATWAGMMAFLDEQYPTDVFPENAVLDADDDLGPRTVRLMRELALLRGEKPQAAAVIDRMREQAGEIYRLRIALDVASAELADERDEARARLAAVRALADKWEDELRKHLGRPHSVAKTVAENLLGTHATAVRAAVEGKQHNHDNSGVYGGCPACGTYWPELAVGPAEAPGWVDGIWPAPVGTATHDLGADDDMFGTTCVECDEPVTDERPAGEGPEGPVHYGCGEQCVCHTTVPCLAHDHDGEDDDALPRCPNDPPCPHAAHDHDHPGYISARATCCVDGCMCGDQAATGPAEAAEPATTGHRVETWNDSTGYGWRCTCGTGGDGLTDRDECAAIAVRHESEAGAPEPADWICDTCGARRGEHEGKDHTFFIFQGNGPAGSVTTTPAEPGYQRIADAIQQLCEESAEVQIQLRATKAGVTEWIGDQYLRLAQILDRAGLIDWTAFQDSTLPKETQQ